MWRAFFLGIGIFLAIVGAQCVAVEKTVLRIHDDPPPIVNIFQSDPTVGPNKTIVVQPWWAWSLMGTGSVTILYSFTISRRLAGG